ncbi:uncharacterized protein LOC113582377 [Electrophorus electricus]|uniref:uncharacterized protein LOC113582377 n=1 Tax=Electrophorus electricus TaxID=8005 RepID=UPI000F09BC6D|nr:uncharacterized protein LOC113582377 [Electrophorus electricus]
MSAVLSTEIKPEVTGQFEVCLGSNTIINCSFQTSEKTLKVGWYISQKQSLPGERINTIFPNGTLNNHYQEERGSTWSFLTIKNITSNDSGWYYCKVIQDIPLLKESNSNSSYLKIKEEENTTSSPTSCVTDSPVIVRTGSVLGKWWVWLALPLGCAVLITNLVVIRLTCCRRQEGPVYENTTKRRLQKEHSPRLSMPMDNSKISKQRHSMKSHSYTSSKINNQTTKGKTSK